MSEYTKHGGNWLAAARSWVQQHCYNGSEVVWGSNSVLNPPLTISQVEEIAECVADAVSKDYDKLKSDLSVEFGKRLRAEMRVSELESQIYELK